MHFRSFDDLNRCIVSNLWKVGAQTDLIVGIPRSGLLAANILSLHLNLPCTDLEGFVNERILSAGNRMKNSLKPFSEYKNVIVIDDSILTGTSLKQAWHIIKQSGIEKNIKFGAVYASPNTYRFIDFYFEICPVPRMFEWNMFHHNYLENCGVDLDGVLCVDPTVEQNDDGEKYEQFVSNATPFLRPTATIGFIVTNRLEKYRNLTEAWLSKNKIHYNKLIMSQFANKAERLKANNHAEFKAEIYKQYDLMLFIESSEWQSNKIARIMQKPVYCADTRKMIYPV